MEPTTTFLLVSPGAIVLFAACIIAIVLPLLAFVIFAINRSLRVKRQHIISINICLSLLILYVGFLISLIASNRESDYGQGASASCFAGALFVLLGWFCLHFWILTNWIYLSFTIQQRVSRHISHFFIKSTIPTYGSALLFFVVIASMDAGQNRDKIELVNTRFCWFDLELEKGVEWVFFLATILNTIGVVCCVAFCCVKFTCKKNKNATAARIKKNKRAVIRLTLLTLIVVLTSALQLSWWLHFSREESWKVTANQKIYDVKVQQIDDNLAWLKILHGVSIAIEGISVVLYLVMPTDNFQSILAYCTAMIKCQDPTAAQHHNVRSTLRSSKHVDNNNVIDVRTSMSSDDRPKYEPRDDVSQNDVFVSSTKASNLSLATTPNEKRRSKSRASTLKSDRGSPSPNKMNDGRALPNLLNPKKKGIRVSFRKSTKTSLSQTSSQPLTTPIASSAPSNHFNFSRDSKLSMKCEHERKTSF